MDSAVLDALRAMYEQASDLEHGPEAIIAMAHPDVEVVPAPFWENMQPSYHGHEGLLAYFADIKQAFGELHYECRELTPLSGEAVISDLLLTVNGPGGGEGRSLAAFQLLQLAGGKIRRSETFLYKKDAAAAATRLAAPAAG